MEFKSIIFKSKYSEAVYLWNGKCVVCVLAPIDKNWKKGREVGSIMNGFQHVNFEEIYNSNLTSFNNGSCLILSKV